MPPKRKALDDITNTAPSTKKPAVDLTRKPDTATEAALRLLTPEHARNTVARLLTRYQDKSGSGYGAALGNSRGCLMVQKGGNRDENGYVQIAPIQEGNRQGTVNGVRQAKPPPQNAHRLVVWAEGSDEDRSKMLDERWQASHLCHESKCIAAAHLVVESKERNEARKACGRQLWEMELKKGSEVIKVESVFRCPCPGKKCIPKVLEGAIVI